MRCRQVPFFVCGGREKRNRTAFSLQSTVSATVADHVQCLRIAVQINSPPDGSGWLKIKNRNYSQAEGRHELLTKAKQA